MVHCVRYHKSKEIIYPRDKDLLQVKTVTACNNFNDDVLTAQMMMMYL